MDSWSPKRWFSLRIRGPEATLRAFVWQTFCYSEKGRENYDIDIRRGTEDAPVASLSKELYTFSIVYYRIKRMSQGCKGVQTHSHTLPCFIIIQFLVLILFIDFVYYIVLYFWFLIVCIICVFYFLYHLVDKMIVICKFF